MLGADSLNLIMSIAESGIVDNAVSDLIAGSHGLVSERPAIKSAITNHLTKWQAKVKQRMLNVSKNTFIPKELALYQQVIHWDAAQFQANINAVIEQLYGHSAFYYQARRLVDKNATAHNPMFAEYFCEQWHQSLIESVKALQLEELDNNIETLREDLQQRLNTLDELTNASGVEPVGIAARIWDMSGAKLSRQDIKVMQQHARFLTKHQELQDIAAQLGRMAQESDDAETKPVSEAQDMAFVAEQSELAMDDIVGIHQSDDLSRMLPNETMFLAYPELEVVFYKHLVDKRLLNYRMQGKARVLRKVQAQQSSPQTIERECGPFILCVDASGSMRGFAEQSAKALAYALMQIALADKRDCYVMLFSTEHISYELTRQDGLREAADFLSYTFHGGTDLQPVLAHSVELMSESRYKNADLVVLSDFIAPKPPQELLAQVDNLKAANNRFHAMSLSKYGDPQVMNIFDHCWSYHPTMVGRLTKNW